MQRKLGRRDFLSLAPMAAAAAALAACGASTKSEPSEKAPQSDYPRTVTDHYGQQTVIKSAKRVIGAYGSVSDTLYGLEEGPRLAAREKLSGNWPPGVIDKLPDIGAYSELNAEGIVSLSPDLFIFPDRYLTMGNNAAVRDQLRTSGVTVLVVPSERWAKDEGRYTLPIMEASIKLIADALAVPEKGDKLIASMRADADAAKKLAASCGRKLRILNLLAYSPSNIQAPGKLTLGEFYVEMLGGINVASEAGLSGFAQIDSEGIVRTAPDVILGLDTMWANGKDGVGYHLSLPGVAETPAGKAKRIIPISNVSIRDSFRLVKDAREQAEGLYKAGC